MWNLFNRAKDRPNKTQKLRVSRVEFITEQLGDVETELKDKLIKILKGNRRVKLVYLVNVRYPDAQDKVALCLKHSMGQDSELVKQVGGEFGKMFNYRESLDIMFLKPEEEERIATVARPFYQSAVA